MDIEANKSNGGGEDNAEGAGFSGHEGVQQVDEVTQERAEEELALVG